jgi:hypothetical protein
MGRLPAVAGVSIVAAAAIAACGGGSGPVSRTRASASASHASGIQFASCMRANGVPSFPDPGSGNGGGIAIKASQTSGSGQSLSVNGVPVNGPAFRGAMRKCSKYLPQPPRLTAAQISRLRTEALAMARCMRAHGVPNFPDPVIAPGPGGHGFGIRIGAAAGTGFDATSPAFQNARHACGGILGAALAAVGLHTRAGGPNGSGGRPSGREP